MALKTFLKVVIFWSCTYKFRNFLVSFFMVRLWINLLLFGSLLVTFDKLLRLALLRVKSNRGLRAIDVYKPLRREGSALYAADSPSRKEGLRFKNTIVITERFVSVSQELKNRTINLSTNPAIFWCARISSWDRTGEFKGE